MKAGVLLSGSGVMDGSEIHEAVLTLLHLDLTGAETICLAPNDRQVRVVDHVSNAVSKNSERNILIESARIARGDIWDIASVSADQLDVLVLPGGFGAAVNLCSFADDGPACIVRPDVERLILDMVGTKKPVGALCIAPALLARVLGGKGLKVKLTIGNDPATAKAIHQMGAIHVNCPVREAVIDREHRVVTAPAYMLAQSIREVDQSVQALVDGLMTLR